MDPFGLSGTGSNKQERQRRVYQSPSQPLDKGSLWQKMTGTSDQAKEAKKRRGTINEQFRDDRKKTREAWRLEDQKVREQDRKQKEDLERYYGVNRYEKDSPQWQDAMKRVDEKFDRYKKDMKRDTFEQRNEQMRDLQRQRDKSVTQMWKVLRSAGDGEESGRPPRGERLL
jgi:hypothetical protein